VILQLNFVAFVFSLYFLRDSHDKAQLHRGKYAPSADGKRSR